MRLNINTCPSINLILFWFGNHWFPEILVEYIDLVFNELVVAQWTRLQFVRFAGSNRSITLSIYLGEIDEVSYFGHGSVVNTSFGTCSDLEISSRSL